MRSSSNKAYKRTLFYQKEISATILPCLHMLLLLFKSFFFPFFAFSHPTRLRVKTFQNTSTNTQDSAVSEVLIMFRSRPVSQCYLHLKVHAHFQSYYVVKLQFHSDSKNPKHTPPKTNNQNNWYGMIIRKISWNAWTKVTIETAPSSPASMKQHQFTTASTTFFCTPALFNLISF